MKSQKYFRSPVVAILGHVDHGKTTLLDYIRKSHLTSLEYGSMTQKIGAYEITTKFKGYNTNKITFIDTPGHEVFTQLRLRGAQVADIALLVIDAKDSVMPQTIESISHIQAAKIPFIVVINKIDLPEANPEKVKKDLLKHQVIVEEKGGKIPCLNISARSGQGIEELLEAILLIANDLNLEYDPKNHLQAIVIETKKDKRGIVVSLIIKDGLLTQGQVIFDGQKKIKVRQIINDYGQPIKEVYPSTPVEILGFTHQPKVGTIITDQPTKTESTQETKEKPKNISFNDIFSEKQDNKALKIILKTDVYGSVEAINNSIKDKKNLEIILAAVGDINQSDIFLAKTTKAIIIGFNVNINKEVEALAKQEKILIKNYQTIFELLEELNEVSQLIKMKEETQKEIKGEAKILANFIIEGEKIFGIKVLKGKINLGDEVSIFRNNNPIGKSKIVSLKIRAKKINEVKKNQEAGIILSPILDITIGDVIKSIL